jgi:phosphoglycerate dehydrogenase-like enzyme
MGGDGVERLTVVIGEDIGSENLERLRAQFQDQPRHDIEFLMRTDREALIAAAPQADIIFTKSLPAEAARVADKLRWIQAGTAGVNHLLSDELLARDFLLTNARGAHGEPMSELMLAMMLAFATGLNALIRAQVGSGPRRIQESVRRNKFELQGQTLCVIGLGDIGGTLARKARGLGMRVLGVRRSGAPFAHADEVFYPDELLTVLPQSDHVALCLPLNEETRGIIGEDELRAMCPTAFIYNVGRGASIDAQALLRALREGWIAGAGLDVTDPEPLPEDSPLWSMPNVLLSQHTSGSSPYNADRITAIFADNLERYLQGEPLMNVVDKTLGY